MIVPPVGGPDDGEKLVIVGTGHCSDEVAVLHRSWVSQVFSLVHQPQSKPVPVLAARHKEQEVPSSIQLYRSTVEK